MKLSLFAHWDPSTNLEAARTWERPGVDGIWIDETLWQVGAFSMASAIASVTERVRVGLGIITPYTMHPTYLAMHYCSLAEISAGRGVIGIGAGVADSLQRIGANPRLPRTAVKETIEIVRAMLAQDKVDYDGKAFTVRAVEPGFHTDEEAPLFWGAMGDRSVETCGEVADGWIISVMEPLAYVERSIAKLRAGAAAQGRDASGFEAVQYQAFACDEDSAAARAEAKELLAAMFRVEFSYFVGMEGLIDMFAADLEDISAADYLKIVQRLRDGVAPVEAVPDALIDQVTIAGDPAECAAQLRRFERLGVTEVALKPGNRDFERVDRLVGEEIAPRLAQLN